MYSKQQNTEPTITTMTLMNTSIVLPSEWLTASVEMVM